MINNKIYNDFFNEYIIMDCCVRSKDIIYFIVEEDLELRSKDAEDSLPDTRFIMHYTDEPKVEEQWAYDGFRGLKRMKAGVSFIPEERFVGVDAWGYVFVIGGGSSGFEDHLHTREGVSIAATACIDGKTWVVGTKHTIYRRDGIENWTLITQEGDIPTDSTDLEDFWAIDGFNEKEIYIACDNGDIWHFNGERWSQQNIAKTTPLSCVCCAEDSYVYIGGNNGTLIKGRGTQWQKIKQELTVDAINNIVWFKDRIYFCTWTHLFEHYKGKTRVIARQPGFPPFFCGQSLSARDGILVSAGAHGAVQYDGEQWTVLVGSVKDIQLQEEIEVLNQTKDLIKDASNLLDDLK